MEQQQIELSYRNIILRIKEGDLRAAIEQLNSLARQASLPETLYELQTLEENYRNLVRYTAQGYKDPKRDEILQTIMISLLSITDDVYSTLKLRFLSRKRSENARLAGLFGADSFVISGRIEEYLVSQQISHLIAESEIVEEGMPSLQGIDEIFKLVWLTERLRDYHLELIRKIIHSPEMRWAEKCLIVSALTLSLLDYFDEQKLLLLIEFVERREPQVYPRALTGLVIGLIAFDDRLKFYPQLNAKLRQVSGDPLLVSEIEMVLYQLLIARETERITREFEQEVLPDMKKMMPRIEDKLQLGDVTDDDDVEGKNPGWKELIDEVPGLFEKIEKFSKMQMEGADVFMGTFAMLKRFDFFNNMSNWFVPFYKENKSIKQTFPDEERYQDRLMEGLEKAFYICNSDKYSFALNFMAVPAAQKSMIVTYFEAELGQMNDMISEEQLLDQSIISNAVFTQYIQDLYRFFKLFPFRSEFNDVFQEKIDFSKLSFYREHFENTSFVERIAGLLFEKEHWSDAGTLYTYLASRMTPHSDYFEKAGYCAQMAGDYKAGIAHYKKAELFDSNPLWIATKLGWCHYKAGEYADAVDCFTRALQLKPEDPALLSRLAQCHLALSDYESALKIYQQLQFFSPENLKILRPLAYCYFASGRCEEAEETYSEILKMSGDLTMYDWMNAGHVKLCRGIMNEAVELYRRSVAGVEPPYTVFFQAFAQDIPLLLRNGFQESEIRLVLDYLNYDL